MDESDSRVRPTLQPFCACYWAVNHESELTFTWAVACLLIVIVLSTANVTSGAVNTLL